MAQSVAKEGGRRFCGALAVCILVIGCQSASHSTPGDLGKIQAAAEKALASGEFETLGRLSSEGVEESARLGDPDWSWRFKHLRFEFLINNEKYTEALQIVDGVPPDHLLARVLIDRARALMRTARLPEAEQALRTASSLPLDVDPSLPVELAVIRADVLRRSGNTAAAEEQYRKASLAAEVAKSPRLQIKSAGNLARLLANRGEFDQAVTNYALVLRLAQSVDDLASVTRANIGLGECYSRLGVFEKALAALQAAVKSSAETHNEALISFTQNGLGNLYYGQGDFEAAIACYLRALESATSDQLRAKWLNNLASAYTERGRWAEAQSFIDRSMQLREKIGETDSNDYPMVNQAELFVAQGKVEEANRVLSQLLGRKERLSDEVLWATYAVLAEGAAISGAAVEANRYFQLAIDQVEQGRERLTQEESQISFRSKWNHFSQSYVDFLVEQGRISEALERAEASRAVLLREGLGIRSRNPHSTSKRLQRLSERLNAVLLSYWVAPKRSFLWVVTPDGIHFHTLPKAAKIDSLVEGYQNYLLRYLDPLPPVGPPNSYSVALFETLVKPALDLIPNGSNVILVPDGSLHNLNYETLLTDAESPHFWIEDVTLSVTPSLAMLQPDPRQTPTEKALLLIGNPSFADEAYPILDGVKQEIAQVSAQFAEGEREVIVGAAAVPEAYAQSRPDRFAWIHFAAHAVANPVDPLSSSVILSPKEGSYRLFAHDVEAVPLKASVVTLSACRGAGAKTYSGEGLVGFAWAFLKAGAHNVVAGLWDVDDQAGARLMDRFYAGMIAGKSPASALREAKLEILGASGEWAKPIYWGPFQIYTGFSPFLAVRMASADRQRATNRKGSPSTGARD